MIIAVCFLCGAVLAWVWTGWPGAVIVVGVFVGCLIGARSPQHFISSGASLKALALKVEDKARQQLAKGKA